MIVYGWDGFEPHRRSHCLNNDCPPSIDWPRLFTATWQKWPKKNLFFAASGSQCVSLSKIFKWGLIFHAALILVWAQYCPDSSVCVCVRESTFVHCVHLSVCAVFVSDFKSLYCSGWAESVFVINSQREVICIFVYFSKKCLLILSRKGKKNKETKSTNALPCQTSVTQMRLCV